MKKFKYLLNVLAICVCVGIVFIGSGYLYLERELGEAENKAYSVPYYSPAPENAGILFKIDEQSVLVYLDFAGEGMRFVFGEDWHIYGYKADYTVKGDYDLVSGIVDILGGIDLEIDGEVLRYTGVQVSELLLKSNLDRKLVDRVIIKITEKIKKIGFQNEDFLYIIENSSTNLNIPDCYYWGDYISGLCENVRIVN